MNALKTSGCLALILWLMVACVPKSGTIVHNMDEFRQAVAEVQPGEVIELANGVWQDVELLIETAGTLDNPITVQAQESGKVFIEGLSNLTIAGTYIIVKGLVFKNGFTPTNEVISFKKSKGKYGNYCRLTECVIDNFNGPERFEPDIWVALYGKNNRVDHCSFIDKRNQGVLMAVRLENEMCQNNNHRIEYNYFGYHQNLGSNGGETLRIGTSQYSLTTSGTAVNNNYFDRCDGETEIISNKSCGNTFTGNTFWECRGTLTFRHGNDNLAEGNFFFGNNKEYTGGIRMINKRNKAINNYFYSLKGYRFRGAMVIMNGVPNSPINRYHQVDGGEFINNTFFNCDHIQLCAGSDAERSATPINTVIAKNLFYNKNTSQIFTVYDDISGIKFSDNYVDDNLTGLEVPGISKIDMDMKANQYIIFRPLNPEFKGIGSSLESPSATNENTGVMWYDRFQGQITFDVGKTIEVLPGLNTITDALNQSQAGDILILSESGEYTMNKLLEVKHPITIKTKNSTIKATLKSGKTIMFEIANDGGLKLVGLELDGKMAPDNVGNCLISTSKYSMNHNYKLLIENCTISNLDVNNSFDFLKVYKNTMADSILIRNCTFQNISGNIMLLDKETEDYGIYNAEYVIIENSDFKDVKGAILSLVRNGTDESTFGPALKISECTFKNVGKGTKNKLGAALLLHGVQVTRITNVDFQESAPFKMELTNGEPITTISNINIYPKAAVIANSNAFELSGVTHNKH